MASRSNDTPTDSRQGAWTLPRLGRLFLVDRRLLAFAVLAVIPAAALGAWSATVRLGAVFFVSTPFVAVLLRQACLRYEATSGGKAIGEP